MHPRYRRDARGRACARLYRQGDYAAAARAYLEAARGVDPAEANRYRYNAALARYKDNDAAGAAETVYPMTMLPGQAAAAELYGAARFREAEDPAAATNTAVRLKALEEAGAGFQQALRQAPDDARRQRNLDRSIKHLPVLRESAHIEKVLAEHGQTPPEALLNRMMQEQRALLSEAPVSFTNPPAARMIRELEALGARQQANSDLWIPLKRALIESQAITNEEDRAQVAMQIEQARDAMKLGARQLADLDGAAMAPIARSEQIAYGFWQLLSMPPGLVAEAIQAQTNAWAHPETPRIQYRPDQEDAAQLTKLFKDRFGPWADQVQQQAQADTNAPSLSPEDRAEIERLTAETVELHAQILKAQQQNEPRPADAQFRHCRTCTASRNCCPSSRSPSSNSNSSNNNSSKNSNSRKSSNSSSNSRKNSSKSNRSQRKSRRSRSPTSRRPRCRRCCAGPSSARRSTRTTSAARCANSRWRPTRGTGRRASAAPLATDGRQW